MKDDRFTTYSCDAGRASRSRAYPPMSELCTCRTCRAMLDVFGNLLAACPSTGRLRRRGTAFERIYRPLWQDSTAREREQPFVTEPIRDADPTDVRQSDVELRGLTQGRGLPVVGDTCMGRALHVDDTPHPGASGGYHQAAHV